MKFMKALAVASILAPSVGLAQEAPPNPTLTPPPVPTNFVFLAPVVGTFIAAPFLIGGGNDGPAPIVAPIIPGGGTGGTSGTN